MNANQSSGMGVSQVMRVLLFFAVLVVSGWILYLIRGTLLPFGIAFVLSYLLVPLVDYIESHRINRLVGVAVVLVSILTIFVSASVLLIPIVAKGMESLMVGFVGQKSEWPVLVVNRSEETIKIEEAGPYGDHSDFSFVNFEPFDLKPGERDTLTIQFKPTVTAGQQDSLRLVCFLGSDKLKPIKFHLIGNRQKKDQGYDLSSDWFFKVEAKTEAETDKVAVIELSGIIYRFGSYSPGYLDHVNMQLANLQPELEESFAVFVEVVLAEYAKEKNPSFGTDMLKETPEVLGTVV
ncbi:MAG: AI-2E family transporter, partial [bacterium]|nr:AI-2E family transporter [bacterium]